MSKSFYSKSQLRQLSWVAALLLGGFLVISAVEKKADSLVQGVEVKVRPLPDGAKLIEPADVLEAVGRALGYRLEGLPVRAVEVQRVERALEADPLILDADVYLNARNVLQIGVKQREPIVRIIDRDGLDYYLDVAGRQMPLSRHYSARVITATGNIPPFVPDFQQRRHNAIKDAFRLALELRQDEFLRAQMEQIYITSTKEMVLIPMVGDQKIVFGRYEDVTDKLQNLKIFYREGMPHAGWRTYRRIDLRYRGQVVCK